jgi:FAD/FMN-containing dehydrogenase
MKELENICEIRFDGETTKKYSRDASIFEVAPQAVAFPKNKEELSALIVYASEHNITLSPRSGGTCMSGGSLTSGVMVDMTAGFSYIKDIDIENKTVWVGGGTYHRDIEKKLTPRGLLFAPYTSSKDLCGIGGMVGNNASGEKSFRYGATIDNVRSLKMICSDGQEYHFGEISQEEWSHKKTLPTFEGVIYRGLDEIINKSPEILDKNRPKVKKNAAGYGLWNIFHKENNTFNVAKLIVGSQGTLGFVTDIELALVDLPLYYSMLVCRIDNLKDLAKVVAIMASHTPEGIETYDIHTYELAKKLLPEDAARASLSDGAKLVVFAQFSEKTQEETESKAHACKEVLRTQGYEGSLVSKEEGESHFVIRRASFKLLKDYAHGNQKAVPFIEDTIVPLAQYDTFLEGLESILKKYDMTYTYAGHIGDGSIRLIPLVNLEEENAPKKILSLAEEVYALTISLGGSISVDHNDGIIRTPFLSMQYDADTLALFDKTKNLFDPKHIFNPGKKVGSTREYAEHTMIKSNAL